MKSRLIPSLFLILFSCLSLQAAESLKVEGSTSPDGKHYLQVTSPHADRSVSVVELVSTPSDQPAEGPIYIGYGYYPSTAESDVLQIVWAPDSKTVAIMTRSTKRTFTLDICSLTEKGLQPITLSTDITKAALKELGAADYDRSIREKPFKWLDSDRLIVRASGDIRLNGENVRYEVDMTCSVSKKAIISAQKITLGPVEN